MPAMTKSCPVSNSNLFNLEDYSRRSGASVQQCVDEAVSEFLNCVATVRLERIEGKKKR
ncbi:MAG: hypothetical protein ABI380_08855 [Edaphobacter sp.]